MRAAPSRGNSHPAILAYRVYCVLQNIHQDPADLLASDHDLGQRLADDFNRDSSTRLRNHNVHHILE